MTAGQLIDLLQTFDEYRDVSVVIAGWSAMFTVSSVEHDCRNGVPVDSPQPVIVIEEKED